MPYEYNGLVVPDFQINRFKSPDDLRDYSDSTYFLLLPDNKGNLSVESPDGNFKVDSFEAFLRLFKRKFNWFCSNFNEIDCAFKFLTHNQLIDLTLQHKISIEGYTLYWIVGTGKIRLTEGKNDTTSKYLCNVGPYIPRTYSVDTLDKLKDIVEKIIFLNDYLIPVNPTSPASTTKDFLLDICGDNFRYTSRCRLKALQYLHTGFVGPRMEARSLGTLEGVDNLDMVKAHLSILKDLPSTCNEDILYITSNVKEVLPEAHPGSVYTVEITVPNSYYQFSPIPLRLDGNTYYPHGTFVARLPKPYLDLADRQGDISYKVIDSVQAVMKTPLKYPFRELVGHLESLEENFGDLLKPLILKNFHYALAGHMLHYHEEMADDLSILYKTSQDYNPLIPNAILGLQSTALWSLSQTHKTEAIRIDALSGYGFEERVGFKMELSGLMTFLTQNLKDKPGSSMYRDLITKYRDRIDIPVSFPMRSSIEATNCQPHLIGKLGTMKTSIRPMLSNRKEAETVNRIGKLLEGSIQSPIYHVDEILSMYKKQAVKEGNQAWIDNYLRVFPQI